MPTRYLALGAVLAGSIVASSCSPRAPAQPRSFDLGQRVSLGHLTYTAFETQWNPQLGAGPTARVPQYRFLLVRLRVINGGGEEALIPNLTIEDDKGESHDELNNGDGVANWVGFIRRAKPAEAVDGAILFDAPPQHYRLKVADENGDRTAYIDLPLTFGPDLPDLPAPAPVPAPPPASPGRN